MYYILLIILIPIYYICIVPLPISSVNNIKNNSVILVEHCKILSINVSQREITLYISFLVTLITINKSTYTDLFKFNKDSKILISNDTIFTK